MDAAAVKAFDPALGGGGKAQGYAELRLEIMAMLEGETDRTAKMATVCAMLAQRFERFFWTGFYVVDVQKGDELVVGPYQGTPACLRIPFSRGVCGRAAISRSAQIVRDVHADLSHIACDSRSQSEIVLPVIDAAGALIAVLDVDAVELDAFDAEDAEGLQAILTVVFGADV